MTFVFKLLLIIPKNKDYIVRLLNFIFMYFKKNGLGKAKDQCKKSNKQSTILDLKV